MFPKNSGVGNLGTVRMFAGTLTFEKGIMKEHENKV